MSRCNKKFSQESNKKRVKDSKPDDPYHREKKKSAAVKRSNTQKP